MAVGLAWTLGLWFYYILVMWLKKKRESLKRGNRLAYYFGYIVAAVFLVLDAVYNIVVGTVMFADIPREFLFTTRLIRYRRGPMTWRYRLATFFCKKMLNPHDPSGEHC